jgi:hypothetical protein
MSRKLILIFYFVVHLWTLNVPSGMDNSGQIWIIYKSEESNYLLANIPM